MKGKKILTGLLCAAVAGNLVAGVAPGRMCDVSAASAQTSIEQKKVVQTTKDLEQKRYNGVPGYQYKDIYATERVTITITARTKAGNKATYKVVVSPAQ